MSVASRRAPRPDFPTTCVLPRVVPDGLASTSDLLGIPADFATPPPSLYPCSGAGGSLHLVRGGEGIDPLR